MIICKYLEWLYVTDEKKITLINSDRLTKIVKKLITSTAQQFFVLFFINRKVKIQALRELFSNYIKKESNENIATLRVDNINFYFNHAAFFAESDSSTTIILISITFCHKIEFFFIQWANITTVQNVYDILHARIFCQFSDVLCIFVDDFLNFKSVVNRLKIWIIVERKLNFL